MFLTLDSKDKRPIYQQIVDGIKLLIAQGELRDGMALPSIRQVASDLGVNLNTIAIAYRQLQEEGLVAVHHGRGATISSEKSRSVPREELRKPLRTALAQMVLAGLSVREITDAVHIELKTLQKKEATR